MRVTVRSHLWLAAIACVSCSESLPSRIEPQNTLEISDVVIEQGAGPGGIHVAIAVDVRNNYEETFSGLIDVDGNIHIWMKRNPTVEANVRIRTRADLELDPDETHFINSRWFLNTDDGVDVLDLLDFTTDDVRFGIHYAVPEIFLLEVKVTLFNETGLLTSGPHEFILQGWRNTAISTDGQDEGG